MDTSAFPPGTKFFDLEGVAIADALDSDGRRVAWNCLFNPPRLFPEAGKLAFADPVPPEEFRRLISEFQARP